MLLYCIQWLLHIQIAHRCCVDIIICGCDHVLSVYDSHLLPSPYVRVQIAELSPICIGIYKFRTLCKYDCQSVAIGNTMEGRLMNAHVTLVEKQGCGRWTGRRLEEKIG